MSEKTQANPQGYSSKEKPHGCTDNENVKGIQKSDKKKVPKTNIKSDSLSEYDIAKGDSALGLEATSNQNYHGIVVQIVEIATQHLTENNKDKSNIRCKFIRFFIIMLSLQMAATLVFIMLSSFRDIPFYMSNSLLKTFITAVFVETLSVIAIMIGFAFASKEEVRVIQLLTAIIENYQKYRNNDSGKNGQK